MYGLVTWVMLFYCTIYTPVRALDSDEHKCGATHGHRIRRHDHELFPRRPPSGNRYGSALEFETGQAIQYSTLRIPSKTFSVDFWMRPEGGQQNPAIVLHAYDKCAPENEARGWFIGLREASVTSDLRISFTVHSASAHSNKTIMSHQKVEPRRWYHVAATYDGIRMKLYVNQAKVAVGYGQKGMIFDSTTQGHACDHLEVGGDVKRGLFYRGQIDKLRLWNDEISHRALTQTLPENTIDNAMIKIVMYDDYNDYNDKDVKNVNWIPVTDQYPRFVSSTVPEDKHDLSIRKPPCGKTICDNPEVIKSYLKHPGSRGLKHLRIQFINVMDDDGRRATLKDSEINSQFELMQRAFSRYNITWEMTVKSIRNSSLRGKTIFHSTEREVSLIGNGFCDDSCNLEITGWDGGDCKMTEKKGNGVCDPECNSASYNYDWGECCTSRLSTLCIDPKSPNRRYVSANDYRKAVSIDNRDALNVYVVNWTDEKLLGLSTFPWEKAVHTELGGVIVPPKNFGTTKALIHEIGHILGLWHVHYGSISGDMMCSDDCFETFPSLELGDLCSDTNPTVKHTGTICGDPVVTVEQTCGLPLYTNTPYDNYMSYADDSCTNHFTPQQVARMHCYIDLDYQSWQTNPLPSFVPLPPHIMEVNEESIKLSWLPPFGPGGNNAINLCNECDDEHMLEQYATTAFSPTNIQPHGSNAPHQAIGPPDGGHCNPSKQAWQPPEEVQIVNPDCPLYLEVGFKQAVVPNEITIWVPYSDIVWNTFSDIVLVYVDGLTESVGNGTAQCDSPFTKPLYVKKKVASVRIYVSHVSVCIDAVKLMSGTKHPNCSNCKPLHYVVRREPPFDTGHEIRVTTARFEEKLKNIDVKGRYEYKVRAVTHEDVAGPFSPPLIYEAKRGFCGDGEIDEGENCDDGNVRDGDGCNIQCQMEDVFRCNGQPSLCYRHDGDGVCEIFEKRTSIKDCGFYTPDGFRDQWVDRAAANSKYNYTCKPDGIIGAPRRDLNCESGDFIVHKACGDGWTPSNEEEDIYTAFSSNPAKQNLWINVYFKDPAIASALVVYLASIIPQELDYKPPLIKFELHGAKPTEKTTLEYKVTKVCKENPIIIPIHHDLTKPFFKTHYIKIMFHTDVKIAAVSLRSPKYFDPVGLQHCTGSQLFHPSTQKCHNYECNMPQCSKFLLNHAMEIKSCIKDSLEGDTCMVQCDKGFTPVSPFEVMCSGGEWRVDGEAPQCTPVDCGEPNIQNADIRCPDGKTFGKKCVYTCKDGTKQAGTGTELSVTCEADGIWSAITTFCRRTCPLPATPPYSRLLSASKNCNKGKPFTPGESCKYQCKLGYRPSGLFPTDMYRNGDFVQRCLKGGTWTRKRCIPIRCPVHDSKIFRWYNCTLGYKFGSVCRLACPGKKVREVRCGAKGKWDKTFQFCSTEGSCSPPVGLNMGFTVSSCGEHLRPGDECKVTCGQGLRPVVKGDSPRQELKSIMCSPSLQWYPDLSEIRCALRCISQSIGDEYCDEKNNNEDCDYDGGDCCNPEACMNGCDCRNVNSPYYGTVASSGDRLSR